MSEQKESIDYKPNYSLNKEEDLTEEQDEKEQDEQEQDLTEEDEKEEDEQEEDLSEEQDEKEEALTYKEDLTNEEEENLANEQDSEDEDSEDEAKTFQETQEGLPEYLKKESKKMNNTELNNMFEGNINNKNFDETLIMNNKDKLNTKKDLQYFLNAIELLNARSLKNPGEVEDLNIDYLYPHLDDILFNSQINDIQEFKEHKYIVDMEKMETIEIEAEKLCNKEFELSPHQKFIRNFISSYTPYNGVLLYHGLGTGKTCSAIGIAEETREYLKLNNINNRIIIVASPNVQKNFMLQLFDERKLTKEDGLWKIDNCAGNNLLKEINMLNDNISKEKVIKIVENIIDNYYLFMGYVEFANLINKKSNVDKAILGISKKKLIKKKLQKFFGNRLIIIDEIHNIRETLDSSNKLVAKQLMHLVTNVDNMKLVLMSATPMYNDYKEIVYLLNILNMNDKRSTVEVSDIFDKDGNLLRFEDEDGNIVESGREILERKMNGYISYVKGDNPFSFPYRILPYDFDINKSIKNNDIFTYPRLDLNNKSIKEFQHIKMFDLYLNKTNNYQEKVYKYIIHKTDFGEGDSYKYTFLQKPLEALNIVYPNKILEKSFEQDFDSINIDTKILVGKNGLSQIMSHQETKEPPSKNNYKFLDSTMENIFEYNNIEKYSCKIKSILDSIYNSEGPIIIYSQFIDGGLIPMALALESNGFERYGNMESLLSKDIFDNVDKLNLIDYTKINKQNRKSQTGSIKYAKYVMITGDKLLSPNMKEDLKACTDSNNINGEFVKVILISMAGSEGLDFKFIRQIHILEPWYNIHRTEQIIGRGVRTCSHKDLELKKRNVKIFLHGTILSDPSIESVDLLIYRKSEVKAKQIGIITKIMKEMSIDCNLNIELLKLSEENLKRVYTEGIQLKLSNNENIRYNIGDKPNSALCDYMEICSYKCKNEGSDLYTKDENILNTYNESFMQLNNEVIIKKIKNLFIEKFFYTKLDIIQNLSIDDKITIMSIDNALNEIINNKIILKDKYNRSGYIINIDDLYIYQPEELNKSNSSLYSKTVPFNLQTDKIKFDIPKDIKNVKVNFDKKTSENPIHTYRNTDINLFTKINEIFNALINRNKEEILKVSENKDALNLLYEFCDKIHTGKYNYINIKNEDVLPDATTTIDYKTFRIIVISILLDSLDFKNHKELFAFIFTKEFMVYKNDNEKEIYTIIKNYYENNIIYKNTDVGDDDKKRKYIIFPISIVDPDIIKNNLNSLDKNLQPYYIFSIDNTNELVPGLYLDYVELQNVIEDKYIIKVKDEDSDVVNYATILGTIKYNDKILDSKKNNLIMNYDFRIRSLNNDDIIDKYNDGRMCTTTPKNSLTKFFKILDIDEDKFVKTFKKVNLSCLGIEIYLRFYDIIKKDNKRWFLNTLESILTDSFEKNKNKDKDKEKNK